MTVVQNSVVEGPQIPRSSRHISQIAQGTNQIVFCIWANGILKAMLICKSDKTHVVHPLFLHSSQPQFSFHIVITMHCHTRTSIKRRSRCCLLGTASKLVLKAIVFIHIFPPAPGFCWYIDIAVPYTNHDWSSSVLSSWICPVLLKPLHLHHILQEQILLTNYALCKVLSFACLVSPVNQFHWLAIRSTKREQLVSISFFLCPTFFHPLQLLL